MRVLDADKQPLGVLGFNEALKLAQARQMDLIEVAPNAVPPVCRIMEYGKFLYEESKKKRHVPGSQSGNRMKELQLSANIDPHDFQVKLARAIRFLSEDTKVRVKLRFRGRQRAHKEFGFDVMNRFVQGTVAYGRPDMAPKMAGDRDLHVTINPLPKDQRAKSPKGQADLPPDEGDSPEPDEADAVGHEDAPDATPETRGSAEGSADGQPSVG